MKVVNSLSICAGLLLALVANAVSARPGGGFGGHAGFSGASHFSGHGVNHSSGWGGRAGWHGGRWGGGGWVGGIYVDPWWYADAYPYYGAPGAYAYDAYPGVVAAPASPPVYVAQGGAVNAAPAAPQSDWYYCRSPAGYYPYVKSCGQAWQRVPAQPPGAQ